MPSLYYPPRIIRRKSLLAGSGLRRRLPTARTRIEHERGTDNAGRFIGPGDVERGFAFFQAARGAAPLVRQSLPASVEGKLAAAPARPPGRARAGQLSPAQLRELWQLHRVEGRRFVDCAAHFSVALGTIAYHFRRGGSVAMRAALARAA
jgi:hypothetical protein